MMMSTSTVSTAVGWGSKRIWSPFIVAGLAGFDTSVYSIGFFAGWADDQTTTIRDPAAQVLKTAHTIAEIIEHSE